MVRLLESIFGKPFKETRFHQILNWASIIIYFIGLIALAIYTINGGEWYYLVSLGIGFPLVSRLTKELYKIFINSLDGEQDNASIVLIVVILAFFAMAGMGAILLMQDTNADGVSKKETESQIQVSLGNLTGVYRVNTVKTDDTDGGQHLSVPYVITVEEGSLYLKVVTNGDTILRERVSPYGSGTIPLDADGSKYDIVLFSDGAKNIQVQLGE